LLNPPESRWRTIYYCVVFKKIVRNDFLYPYFFVILLMIGRSDLSCVWGLTLVKGQLLNCPFFITAPSIIQILPHKNLNLSIKHPHSISCLSTFLRFTQQHKYLDYKCIIVHMLINILFCSPFGFKGFKQMLLTVCRKNGINYCLFYLPFVTCSNVVNA